MDEQQKELARVTMLQSSSAHSHQTLLTANGQACCKSCEPIQVGWGPEEQVDTRSRVRNECAHCANASRDCSSSCVHSK
jgi:hypothetical protein